MNTPQNDFLYSCIATYDGTIVSKTSLVKGDFDAIARAIATMYQGTRGSFAYQKYSPQLFLPYWLPLIQL
jgi:hypothetical protein